MKLLWRQARAEFVMLWRNPASLGFTILFPILFLVIFSSIFGAGGDLLQTANGQMRFIDFYLPGIVVFATVQACFSNLAMQFVYRREQGILKRKRGTPLPAWALIGGLVLAVVVLALVLTVVTTAVSMVAWNLAFPRHLAAVLGTVVLGAACYCSLGVAVTRLVPNEDAAPAIINIAVFPLLFLSGIFFPVTKGFLRTLGRVFPIGRMSDALARSYAPAAHSCKLVDGKCVGLDRVAHASGPHLADLGVIALWLVAGVLLSIWSFRWEPRQG
jgi:ABC-2 type transport system permease protein